MNGSVMAVALIRATAEGRAGQIVLVVVGVAVERERARGQRAEQSCILGMLRHGFRHALAADVLVEANDAVARRHHHMQVVADQQDADAAIGAERAINA